MGNDIITVLINCENGIEELKETIHSLQNQKDNFWEKTSVIALFDEKAEQESRTEQEAYLNSMETDRGKIRVLGCQNIWNGYEEAMEQVDSPYLILMNSGDAVEDEALVRTCASLEKHSQEADLVMMNCLNRGKKVREGVTSRKDASGKVEKCYCVSLNVLDDIGMVPGYWDALVWKTEAVRGMRFDQRHGAETKIELIYRILDRGPERVTVDMRTI